jgi:hypothetical protein
LQKVFANLLLIFDLFFNHRIADGYVGVTGILEPELADPRSPISESISKWRIHHVDALCQFGRTVWSDGSFNVRGDVDSSRRFHVSFVNAADFLIDFAEKEIIICEMESCSSESVRHLLHDQIIPRILAHEGQLVLHSAGVAGDAGAILLLGPSGSGKSSLAASLHNSGHPLLGDDATVVSTSGGKVTVHAVYRSLRLFPDSIAALIGGPAQLTPVAAYTTKQNVTYPDDRPADEGMPIRAAFLLEPAHSKTVTAEPIAASEACMAFVEHSFWMDPTDLSCVKARMVQASALAGSVSTFRLAYPRQYSSLPAVRDAIARVLA